MDDKITDQPKALFISIDGLTDPLGQSQILPYLCGLAQEHFSITIISCEKESNLQRFEKQVRDQLNRDQIAWEYTLYKKRIPFLSQIDNFRRLRKLAFGIASSLRKPFIVHCRSYLPAFIGFDIKRKWGAFFLFDMRGFWADERTEGGIWKLKNPIHRFAYRFIKRKEPLLLQNADYIVSLTDAAKKILPALAHKEHLNCEVIPCCTDLNHFQIPSDELCDAYREKLGIEKDTFILGYLGSLGTWYMHKEMLEFFKLLLISVPRAVFLFVSNDSPDIIMAEASRMGIRDQNIKIVSVPRKEVPSYISTFNVGIFFIRPSYSKLASSPTKMGEILACGIPVITNTGIGDCDTIIRNNGCGILVSQLDSAGYSQAIEELKSIKTMHPVDLRKTAERIFSLERGIASYKKIYQYLLR